LNGEGLDTSDINEMGKENPSNTPGITTSAAVIVSGKVGSTMFYNPVATDPMDVPFKAANGKPFKSGKDLASFAADPKAFNGSK